MREKKEETKWSNSLTKFCSLINLETLARYVSTLPQSRHLLTFRGIPVPCFTARCMPNAWRLLWVCFMTLPQTLPKMWFPILLVKLTPMNRLISTKNDFQGRFTSWYFPFRPFLPLGVTCRRTIYRLWLQILAVIICGAALWWTTSYPQVTRVLLRPLMEYPGSYEDISAGRGPKQQGALNCSDS